MPVLPFKKDGDATIKEYERIAMAAIYNSASTVVLGHAYWSPYIDKVSGEKYITFAANIKAEGEPAETFDSIGECVDAFIHAMTDYVDGRSRIIVRKWPEIVRNDGKYRIYCRLMADDGIKELTRCP